MANNISLLKVTLVLGLMIFSGCQDSSPIKENSLSGTIEFSDGISLDSLIRARVTIEDTSIADAASVLVSVVTISPIEKLPIRFSITYNVSEIVSSHSYSLHAEVFEINEKGEEVRAYITTQSYPILTNEFSDWDDHGNKLVLTQLPSARAGKAYVEATTD